MASGALLRATSGAVFLVKPAYKPIWEIPGGLIEPGESPRSCCTRELREELGLELSIGRVLVIDWLPPTSTASVGWMFVYDGGILDEESISRIVLPPEELVELRLVQIEDVDQYLVTHMARRIRVAYECAIEGTTVDLECGVAPTAHR